MTLNPAPTSIPTDTLAAPSLRLRASYRHWIHEHVRWSDTDMAGHANNLAFAAFAETGRAILLRRFMAPDANPRALLVLAEFRMKYLSEAYWPAEVEVGTGVSTIGTRSCRMVQGLFVGDHCISVAESVLVLIDETTRKSGDIPDDVRSFLKTYWIDVTQLLAACDQWIDLQQWHQQTSRGLYSNRPSKKPAVERETL